ncbi:MAG TPA: hypothetical protein VKX25_00730 [Bryobacteraceae bacterium]|jgi:hypothetical protein|nr:hypothetical protein [Bryobacteraceae bacterium]
MPAAREAERTVEITPQRAGAKRRSRLLFAAGALAVLCASAAFLVLVLRDHGHTQVMVHDQAAPHLATSSASPAPAAPSHPRLDTSQPAASRASFRLERGNAVNLGPIRVRLTKTDPRRGLYDFTVLSGRRSFSHRHLRLNVPVWIALGKEKGALEILVTSIDKRVVEGTWIVSTEAPEVIASRSHKR